LEWDKFKPDKFIELVSNEHPWKKPDCDGYRFRTAVLTENMTVAELIARGRAAGFKPTQVEGHLRWLFTGIDENGRPYIKIDGIEFDE
jgi:hypothetical protein